MSHTTSRLLVLFFCTLFLASCRRNPPILKVVSRSLSNNAVTTDVIARKEEQERQELLAKAECYQKKSKNGYRRAKLANELSTQEAKLFDIPVPLETTLLASKTSDAERNKEGVVLNYNSRLEVDELAVFFNREMPCFGWQLIFSISDESRVLVFEKPTRLCVVVIHLPAEKRRNGVISRCTISVGAKSWISDGSSDFELAVN